MYPLMYRLATTVDEGAIERRATLPTVPNIVRCRAKDMFYGPLMGRAPRDCPPKSGKRKTLG